MTKRLNLIAIFFALVFLCQSGALAQKADFSLLLGASKIPDTNPATGTTQSFPGKLALQANLGVRLFHAGPASTFLEFPFTAVPSQPNSIISGTGAGALVTSPTGNLTSYLFTPGLRMQFGSRSLSPYVAAGAGFTRATVINATQLGGGTVSTAQSRNTFAVADVGGGFNARLNGLVDLRAEVRNYIRVTETLSQSRNNLVALAGFAVRF